MKYLFLISCLVLCACFSKDEAAEPYEPCQKYIHNYEPVKDPDPSVLDYCPAEDVAEYPVRDTIPDDWCRNPSFMMGGGCLFKLKLSKEELLFGAQGGVRCITTDRDFGLAEWSTDRDFEFSEWTTDTDWSNYSCAYEDEAGVFGIGGGGGNPIEYFKKLKCPEKNPWLAATKIDTRVLHISVDKNETGSERKWYIYMSCQATLTITQLAD